MSDYVTASDGVRIAFEAVGEGVGPPAVLVHGFGANKRITWANTNWYQTLTRAGKRVIAIDCRGHGESGKPLEAQAYDEGRMAADVVAVLDALAVNAADVMGYSMGGYLAIRLMKDSPARVRRAVLAGVGKVYFGRVRERDEIIAQGMLAADPAAIADPTAREFRQFCDRAGDDLQAMAACMRRDRIIFPPEELKAVAQAVLVVCGSDDAISGPPEPLAQAFAHGTAYVVPRRNHHSTVGDPLYKEAVTAFLKD